MDDSFIIYIGFYAILILTDLIPDIKSKDKKALWVLIPIFIVTFVVNILNSLGMIPLGIHDGIDQILKSTMYMK